MEIAIKELQTSSEKFAARSMIPVVRLNDEGVASAVQAAEGAGDIRESALLFESKISIITKLIKERENLSNSNWTGKLAKFLSKFYPLVKTSLRLTSAISEAFPIHKSFLIHRERT